MLDYWSDKLWAIVAAIISALGGYIMYERRKIDDRLTKLEEEVVEHKADLAVVKESLKNLKEDTEEIKDSNKLIVQLLMKKKR